MRGLGSLEDLRDSGEALGDEATDDVRSLLIQGKRLSRQGPSLEDRGETLHLLKR